MRWTLTLILLIVPLTAICQDNGYNIVNKGDGRITIIHNGKSINFIQEEICRAKEITDSIKLEDYKAQIDGMENDMKKEMEDVKLKYFMIGFHKGVEFQYNWSIQGNIGKVIDIHKSDINPEARKIVIEEGNKYFNKIFSK